jgi:4-amino-4-deoxychorismate lyase
MHYYEVNGLPNTDISVTNRAFNYGDGVFTTTKISAGKIEFLAEHRQRLDFSCHTLSIDFSQQNEVFERIIELAKSYQNAILKIVVCAGAGGRGYSRAGVVNSDVIISIHDMPNHYELWQRQGIVLGKSPLQLGLNPLLKGLKHLNRLEQVLIRSELDQRAEDDVVVSDINNHVIETSTANIFWQKDGELYTPDLTDSGIFGIARQQLLALFPDTQIVKADMALLEQVNAMFICNCVMGIVPVNSYQGRLLDVASLKNIQRCYRQQQARSCGLS